MEQVASAFIGSPDQKGDLGQSMGFKRFPGFPEQYELVQGGSQRRERGVFLHLGTNQRQQSNRVSMQPHPTRMHEHADSFGGTPSSATRFQFRNRLSEPIGRRFLDGGTIDAGLDQAAL